MTKFIESFNYSSKRLAHPIILFSQNSCNIDYTTHVLLLKQISVSSV